MVFSSPPDDARGGHWRQQRKNLLPPVPIGGRACGLFMELGEPRLPPAPRFCIPFSPLYKGGQAMAGMIRMDNVETPHKIQLTVKGTEYAVIRELAEVALLPVAHMVRKLYLESPRYKQRCAKMLNTPEGKAAIEAEKDMQRKRVARKREIREKLRSKPKAQKTSSETRSAPMPRSVSKAQ